MFLFPVSRSVASPGRVTPVTVGVCAPSKPADHTNQAPTPSGFKYLLEHFTGASPGWGQTEAVTFSHPDTCSEKGVTYIHAPACDWGRRQRTVCAARKDGRLVQSRPSAQLCPSVKDRLHLNFVNDIMENLKGDVWVASIICHSVFL